MDPAVILPEQQVEIAEQRRQPELGCWQFDDLDINRRLGPDVGHRGERTIDHRRHHLCSRVARPHDQANPAGTVELGCCDPCRVDELRGAPLGPPGGCVRIEYGVLTLGVMSR